MIRPIKVCSKINGFVTLPCVVEASYHDRSERKTCPIDMKIWILIVLVGCYKHVPSQKSVYNPFYRIVDSKSRIFIHFPTKTSCIYKENQLILL